MIDKHYLERIDLMSGDRDRREHDSNQPLVSHGSTLGNYKSPGTKAMVGDGQILKSQYDIRYLYLK
jgi:hypothetical protein